jgi:hypothetical protein
MSFVSLLALWPEIRSLTFQQNRMNCLKSRVRLSRLLRDMISSDTDSAKDEGLTVSSLLIHRQKQI